MVLVALVVVAAAVMAAAWALHPSWARGRVEATDGPTDVPTEVGAEDSVSAPLQRFFAHFHLPHRGNGNGNGNGNGHGTNSDGTNGSGSSSDTSTSLEDVLAESPIVTPGARDDIDAEADGSYLEGFDLRSVARFAVRFFGCVLAAMIVATFALWAVASILGLVGAFERFMRGIGFTDFSFLSMEFLLGICMIGAAFSLFMVVMTLLAAGLYNVLAHRWQGVRIFVSDGRSQTPAPSISAATPARPAAPAKEPVAVASNGVVSSDGEVAPPPPRLRSRRVLARGGRRVRP